MGNNDRTQITRNAKSLIIVKTAEFLAQQLCITHFVLYNQFCIC